MTNDGEADRPADGDSERDALSDVEETIAPGSSPDAGLDAATAPNRIDQIRAVVQDAHINFLIGAGTSSALFAPLGDIEEALTAIDDQSEPGSQRDLARASVQALFFDAVVMPNVDLIANERETPAVVRSYAGLAQALNRLLLARRSSLLSKQANIFTTNIDLAIEVAFERLGLTLSDGFTGRFELTYDPATFGTTRFRSSPHYGHRSEVPSFDLFKIHGSVGWKWQDERGSIVFDRSLSDVKDIRAALEDARVDLIALEDPNNIDVAALLDEASNRGPSADVSAFITAYNRLAIVNPTKTKFATTVLTEIYYELIRRLANELERESTVLFVLGFSFRDEHLRSILLRAARTNPTLQVYVFCHGPTTRGRYEALIPSEAVPNRNIAYLEPEDENSRLSLDKIVTRYIAPLGGGLPNRVDHTNGLSSADTQPRDSASSVEEPNGA